MTSIAKSTTVSHPNSKPTYNCHNYPLTSLALMFFSFSFSGWVWEVGLNFYNNGTWVNRGVLHGPWLPIYGVGMVLMLILLNRFQNKPFLCFGMAMTICGIVEFTTSWILEKLLHAVWWDYSHKFMNLHGRIYLGGLLLFGAAGCLVIYVVAPFINRKLTAASKKKKVIICVVLGLLFITDLIFSIIAPNMGTGISKMI